MWSLHSWGTSWRHLNKIERVSVTKVQKLKVKVKSLSHVRRFATPWDYSLPGSSVHGIFQAIVLEWIAISFSRGSSQTRGWTLVSHIVDRHFTVWATRGVEWNPVPSGGLVDLYYLDESVLALQSLNILSYSDILKMLTMSQLHLAWLLSPFPCFFIFQVY